MNTPPCGIGQTSPVAASCGIAEAGYRAGLAVGGAVSRGKTPRKRRIWPKTRRFPLFPPSGVSPKIAGRTSLATAAGGIAEARLPSRFFRRRDGFSLLFPRGRDGKGAFRRIPGIFPFSRPAGTAPGQFIGYKCIYLFPGHILHPHQKTARNRHNKLCLGRCLNNAPRCGGKKAPRWIQASPPVPVHLFRLRRRLPR
jgi:hypothetical protein